MNALRPYPAITSPDGQKRTLEFTLDRVTIGRMQELNDVALEPDPQKTRPVAAVTRDPCLMYDWVQARLYRIEGGVRTEVANPRPQEHKLIRYMAQRNHANGGVPVLCSYDQLIAAVWGEEAMHTQDEVTHLVWDLRQKLERVATTPSSARWSVGSATDSGPARNQTVEGRRRKAEGGRTTAGRQP